MNATMETNTIGHLNVHNKSEELIAQLELHVGENVIGRLAGEQTGQPALVEDAALSRMHFIIQVEKDEHGRVRFFLKDNHSTNGTFLKSAKLARDEASSQNSRRKVESKDYLQLENGDTILGGNTRFILVIVAPVRKGKDTRINDE